MLSLYVHIPFCVGKCRYCGFYSTLYHKESADRYLKGLTIEASLYQTALKDRVISTVYLGGGTPTCLDAGELSAIFSILRDNFNISNTAEITIEANPGTIDLQKLNMLLYEGANRLSIGVQSFSDEILRQLGRIHDAGQAREAVNLARKSGFKNIGVDLIFGIPGQKIDEWRESLSSAISLKPEHVSAYCLSIDEGSLFEGMIASGELAPVENDVTAEMYAISIETLSAAGYGHYEISNFSLPGFECRHNMNYWDRGEYIGLGPAAWSFIGGRRCCNVSDTAEYSRRLFAGSLPVEYEERPDKEQAEAERLMLGLRTGRGVDVQRITGGSGRVMNELAGFEQAGLARASAGRVSLTDRGMFVSNEVFERLFR